MMYDGVINKPPLDELYHFNKNHDPNNGQFTSGSGGKFNRIDNKQLMKYQTQDGSLTKKGEKVFGKLINLNNQYKKQNKQITDQNNRIYKYFKENYKGEKLGSETEMERRLYRSDKNFKKMVDDRQRLVDDNSQVFSDMIRERTKIQMNQSGFFRLGNNVINEILENNKN